MTNAVQKDSWAIDYQATKNCLDTAKQKGAQHFVLLSAICVQKPLLEFQHAKLKLEAAIRESGLSYSIVRPTAFFKSLAGQVIYKVRAVHALLIAHPLPSQKKDWHCYKQPQISYELS